MQAEHMKCTFKCTIQVHKLAPPTCVLKILVDLFPFSYFSPYVICQEKSMFLSLFHYLCFSPPHLCFSPSLSSMTIKAQNVDITTCRVEIINVNQWGEDHISKFGSNQNICQRYLTQFDPRTSFFTPPNKGYLVPC